MKENFFLKEKSGDKILRQSNKKKKSEDLKGSQVSSKEMQKLQKSNQQLQEENTLLKTKNEILIEMISEVFTEYKLENDLKANKK